MKFAFVAKHRGSWPTIELCEALGVSRPGFYAWLRRPEARRSRDDRYLLTQIRAIHEQSGGVYGGARIARELREWGLDCGRRRVARLMRAAGLRGKPGRGTLRERGVR